MGTEDANLISPAKALAALYNAARPQGMGFLQFQPGDMAVEQAQKIIDRWASDFPATDISIDYLAGRVMKVGIPIGRDIGPGDIDLHLYDRDNGTGAGARAMKHAATN